MEIREIILPPNTKRHYQMSTSSTDGPPLTITNLFGRLQSRKVQLSQLNSIRLTRDNRLQNLLQTPQFPENLDMSDASSHLKKSNCNCKKSKCLKLYCQCFSKQLYCSADCSCNSCANTETNARKLLLIRQENGNKKSTQQKGCKCKKSNCKKKYCECFSRGIECGQYCQCCECENYNTAVSAKKEQ